MIFQGLAMLGRLKRVTEMPAVAGPIGEASAALKAGIDGFFNPEPVADPLAQVAQAAAPYATPYVQAAAKPIVDAAIPGVAKAVNDDLLDRVKSNLLPIAAAGALAGAVVFGLKK